MNGEEITDPDTARGIIRIRLGHYLYQRLASIAHERGERIVDIAFDMLEDAVMDVDKRR